MFRRAIGVRDYSPQNNRHSHERDPFQIALRYAANSWVWSRKSRDVTFNGVYEALALMPTDSAAFSYQPKDLKSVCRGVRARFLLAAVFGRGPTDLPSTFRDTFRLTFVSLGQKALFLVAPLRHQINGEVSRQVIDCVARPRQQPVAPI